MSESNDNSLIELININRRDLERLRHSQMMSEMSDDQYYTNGRKTRDDVKIREVEKTIQSLEHVLNGYREGN